MSVHPHGPTGAGSDRPTATDRGCVDTRAIMIYGMEQPIVVSDVDTGLGAQLHGLINDFNISTTGFDDARWLQASVNDENGELVAGLSGWTWGGSAYVDALWVRADRRGKGIGSHLLAAAEAEAAARGCTQVVLCTHSFQAPDMYRNLGYREHGRIEGYPTGHAYIHMAKDLPRTR